MTDKPRRYRTQPQPLCPRHGVPLLTYSTPSEMLRRLKCPVPGCDHREKQIRKP